MNSDSDCDLYHAKGSLDREKNKHFDIEVKIKTLSAFANPNRVRAKVHVIIVDQNDNPPMFVYDDKINSLVKDQYLVAIPDNTPVDTVVFQVKVRALKLAKKIYS